MKPQPLYTVADIRRLFFVSKSDRWVKDKIKAGAFGPTVLRDAGGWMVPISGVVHYLDQHEVKVDGELEHGN